MASPISLNAAVTGINRGLNSLDRVSADIAGVATNKVNNPASLAKSMIELRESQHQVSASVKVLKAADDMIGTLLDIKA